MDAHRDMAKKDLSYSSAARSLCRDFSRVIYVHVPTDEYVEYLPHPEDQQLDVERRGTGFFERGRDIFALRINPEDRDTFLVAFTKENILRVLEGDKSFSLALRVNLDGKDGYVRLKVMRMSESDPDDLVVGIIDEDAHMRRLQEYKRELHESLTYAGIAESLASDYFCIMYVDTNTDEFVEYSSSDLYRSLDLAPAGTGFFGADRKDFLAIVYPDDRDTYLAAFTKENVLRVLSVDRMFLLTFRVVVRGVPVHIRLKVTRMAGEGDRVVVGYSNIDLHMRRIEEYKKIERQNLTYSRIAEALSVDLFSVFYVDMDTDEYVEYHTDRPGEPMDVERNGSDFFGARMGELLEDVYEEDRFHAAEEFSKQNLLKELAESRSYSSIYRVVSNGRVLFVSSKATRMLQSDSHIIIGISNVDAQIRREEAHAQELVNARSIANRDPLTGVKSKHAFNEAEVELEERIASGDVRDIAVVVCDVNGLKQINDTLGHKAGDEHIRKACVLICEKFKHSPVFRIGGDEFVVLLQGTDYANRAILLAQINQHIDDNNALGDVVIAVGMAEYSSGTDRDFASIFERADAAMYARKRQLKGLD